MTYLYVCCPLECMYVCFTSLAAITFSTDGTHCDLTLYIKPLTRQNSCELQVYTILFTINNSDAFAAGLRSSEIHFTFILFLF